MNAYPRNAKLAAYQSTAAHGGVAGADPHGLVLMLMDATLERMASARGCIERREIVRKTKLLHSSVLLIAELRGTLNMAQGGSIAENLNELYDYMIRRLIHANLNSDVQCIAEVQSLLAEIRRAWMAIGPEVRRSAPTASAA